MSYDFKPTHHIGMTPQGYFQTGRVTKPKTEPRPLQHLTDGALRLRCARGDVEALAEFSTRWKRGL